MKVTLDVPEIGMADYSVCLVFTMEELEKLARQINDPRNAGLTHTVEIVKDGPHAAHLKWHRKRTG